MSTSQNLKSIFLTWVLPIVVGLIVIYTYFSPILGGKVIEQDDILLGYAKSHQSSEFREQTGEEPFWTDAMFGGMPTFQLSVSYPNNWLGQAQELFATLFGRTSWIYIFPIMLICFFVMGRSFEVNHWLSLLGALAFVFSAFFIISFGAGHVSKVRTAIYIPIIISGVVLTYRGWWKAGAISTALGFGLSILSNHFQVTFYTLLLAICIGIVYLIDHLRKKQAGLFVKRTLILAAAGILGAAPNFGNLWTTMSYTQETIRGGNSLQDPNASNDKPEEGLSWDYAMAWSYGKAESLNLFIPFFSGGGAKETYTGTKTHDQLTGILSQQGMSKKQAEEMANQYAGSMLYWGDQSLVNGAYYVGASMVFLFVLGLLIIPATMRNWILAASLLSLFMAWGQNFEFFNRLLFNYLPLYNKFRVPSMALVMLFFLIPLTGILGLKEITGNTLSKAVLKKRALQSLYITGGLALFVALLGSSLFDLSGPRDEQLFQQGFSEDMLFGDRASLLRTSALKSLLFVGLVFGCVWLFITEKIKQSHLAIALLVIVSIDLIPYDRDQLGTEDFATQQNIEAAFAPSQADLQILNDPDLHYRVWNTTASLTSDSYTSYHHKSMGGYHGAKLSRYQDLIEYQLSKGNMACFNMLNAKWVITQDKQGNKQAQRNPQACGNAWFVNEVSMVESPYAEMQALSDFNPQSTAIVDQSFSDYVKNLSVPDSSSQNTIKLTNYSPKELSYQAQVSDKEALAVFSEVYYNAPGQEWHAYIDGEEQDFIRVNYLNRALKIPQGKHEVVFKFIPKTYIMGEKINLAASILLVVGLLVLIYLSVKESKEKQNVE
jgi:hypothetical protein